MIVRDIKVEVRVLERCKRIGHASMCMNKLINKIIKNTKIYEIILVAKQPTYKNRQTQILCLIGKQTGHQSRDRIQV